MFLLVPAHPGCPGQGPKSSKTVVVVVVIDDGVTVTSAGPYANHLHFSTDIKPYQHK